MNWARLEAEGNGERLEAERTIRRFVQWFQVRGNEALETDQVVGMEGRGGWQLSALSLQIQASSLDPSAVIPEIIFLMETSISGIVAATDEFFLSQLLLQQMENLFPWASSTDLCLCLIRWGENVNWWKSSSNAMFKAVLSMGKKFFVLEVRSGHDTAYTGKALETKSGGGSAGSGSVPIYTWL